MPKGSRFPWCRTREARGTLGRGSCPWAPPCHSLAPQRTSRLSRPAPRTARPFWHVAAGGPSRLLGLPWQSGQSVECRHKARLIEWCPVFEDVRELGGDDTPDEAFGLVGGMPCCQEPLACLRRLWRRMV